MTENILGFYSDLNLLINVLLCYSTSKNFHLVNLKKKIIPYIPHIQRV